MSYKQTVALLFSPEKKAKICSLRGLIYGLIVKQGMTTRELVDCLMHEPYSINPNELGLVVIALDGLLEDKFLKVSVKLNGAKFEIESIFNTTFSRHPLKD